MAQGRPDLFAVTFSAGPHYASFELLADSVDNPFDLGLFQRFPLPGQALTVAVGLLGKLPSHGDFLRRGMASELAAPLDAWLAAAVAASRETLGAGWLDAYLTAPVWRFALAAGICGPLPPPASGCPASTGSGAISPCSPSPSSRPRRRRWRCCRDARAWYDRLEELLLAVLEDRVTLLELEATLAAIAPPEPPAMRRAAALAARARRFGRLAAGGVGADRQPVVGPWFAPRAGEPARLRRPAAASHLRGDARWRFPAHGWSEAAA